jgi:GT2 family glycosyltransferase
MEKGVVTICIVNYKTLDLTRLCLRSLRKYTTYPFKVIVVDNFSQDGSTEYLKSLDWIQFVERKEAANDPNGGYAHGAALDLGLSLCDTEYFMSLHSDTFVHKNGWLEELMRHFYADPSTACAGGGKCEMTSQWRQEMRKATDFKTLKRKLFKTPDPLGVYRYYNRTVCSIYRTDVLRKENLTFLMGFVDAGLTVGKKLYFELVDRGFRTVEIPDRIMKKHVWHLAHATQVVNAEEYTLRDRTIRKTNRLLDRIGRSKQVQQIMQDSTLDL